MKSMTLRTRPSRLCAVATLMATLVSTAAMAATVASPPVYVAFDGGEQSILCMYSNLSRKPIEAVRRVEIGGSGASLAIVEESASIDAGGILTSSALVATDVPNAATRCVLDGKFSKKSVQITACAVDGAIGSPGFDMAACVSTP